MWEKEETQHYVFHYHKHSLAEKDITSIMDLQERCFDYICRILRVKMNKKINYFLCESPEEVGKLYGDDEPSNGIVKYPDTVYAVYNEDVKCVGFHEDVHLIAYNTLGNPPQALLREGLAMFFDKVWWGIPNEAWVQVFLKTGLYKTISSLKDNREFFRYSETLTYPISGAFVAYLIPVFGTEKFKNFYKIVDDDFDKSFYLTFEHNLNDVEDNFLGYIQTVHYNETLQNLVLEYLKRAGFFQIKAIQEKQGS